MEKKKRRLLIDGMIPPHTECPYKAQCPLRNACKHQGVNHNTSFSCAAARSFEIGLSLD